MRCAAAAILAAGLACTAARAQSLEPRAYANLPIGLNFLIAGYAYSRGDVLFDPSVPVTDASARVNALLLGYVRSLDFWGNSGSIGLVLPYAEISASGQISTSGQWEIFTLSPMMQFSITAFAPMVTLSPMEVGP